MTQALAMLADHGLAEAAKEPPVSGKGRPVERWFATRTADAINVLNAISPTSQPPAPDDENENPPGVAINGVNGVYGVTGAVANLEHPLSEPAEDYGEVTI